MITIKTGSEIAVELKAVENTLRGIEQTIADELKILNRRRSMKFGLGEDYAKKEFILKITFDEVNTENWLQITEQIHKELVRYQNLRQKQFALQKEMAEKASLSVAQDNSLIGIDALNVLNDY